MSDIYFNNHILGVYQPYASPEAACIDVHAHYQHLLQERADKTGDEQWQEIIAVAIECWEASICKHYGSINALNELVFSLDQKTGLLEAHNEQKKE